MTTQDRRAAEEIADRFVRQYEGEYIAREAADTIFAALQKARVEERERCHAIVAKAFDQNWVAQDCLDAIRAARVKEG